MWRGEPAVLPEQRLTGPTCGFDPPCGSQPAHPYRILHRSSSQADPVTGQPVDAAALRSRLLDHLYPALSDHGDTETITRLLHRLDQRGTGADRQRALFTSVASTPAFITALARATLSGHEPGRQRPGAPVPAAAGAQ